MAEKTPPKRPRRKPTASTAYLKLLPPERRRLLEQLMFGAGQVRRFTQDTPVLPDVWLRFAHALDDDELVPSDALAGAAAADPFPAVPLLVTPFRDTPVGDLHRALRARLALERRSKEWRAFGHDATTPARLVYNQTTVAANLFFEDLIRVVLSMTSWWHTLEKSWNIEGLADERILNLLAEAVRDPEHPAAIPTGLGTANRPRPGLLWMLRVVGFLALVRRGGPLPKIFLDRRRNLEHARAEDWRPLIAAVRDLIQNLGPAEQTACVHVVNINREARRTIAASSLAVKADAARLLFKICCRDLTWAVVDSGIDARHPAFRRRGADEKPSPHPFVVDKKKLQNETRVLETYDFTQIALLLDPDSPDLPVHLEKRLAGNDPESAELLTKLRASLEGGGSFDWKLVRPLLRVEHSDGEYVPPGNDHGTHVAGILAGDWRASEFGGLEESLVGICPDLRLLDLRVLDASGRGEEFAVMAALQFIRYLNSAYDYTVVHGVNMSMSLRHDVSNFACGRTPVCEESERVVAAGVVVVAAAGNQGYRRYTTAEGAAVEAYNNSSITDPGNADLVITVGATHRSRPHAYGVSYFSSRGPTGDGRAKPDLVAPGEKITAPLPGELYGLKDGTSMAAPHVSGAAALLMARHSELVGRPAKVKQILCQTATDLGRERYFQGAGMLDILRALQSV